jgi:hypothetical protein
MAKVPFLCRSPLRLIWGFQKDAYEACSLARPQSVDLTFAKAYALQAALEDIEHPEINRVVDSRR